MGEKSHFVERPVAVGGGWRQSDDVWAMVMATVLLSMTWFCLQPVGGVRPAEGALADGAYTNMLTPWVAKPGGWTADPLKAFAGTTQAGGPTKGLAVAATATGCLMVFVLALAGTGVPIRKSLPGVAVVTLLAVLAWLASTQATIKSLQLSYVLWAFVGGLFMSNVIGVPNWLKPGLRGELFIKTGLVLMGAGLLFGTLMKLGPPGILVSWITTPIVLIGTECLWRLGCRRHSCRLQGEEGRALNRRGYLAGLHGCDDVHPTGGL
ncbi:MAG: putative sulfate exporter family transporter [Planctomycetia bacterium]|nr:putative sulfate exporter family transporter [Planctomycetia bacterium]